MGESSRQENVAALVAALGRILRDEGADAAVEKAAHAVERVYAGG